MSKSNYLGIPEAMSEIRSLKTELMNSKAKRNFDKTTNKIKRVYDKLYYYSFYDYRFHTCNYNKLLEDLKHYQGKLKTQLLFLKIPDMVKAIYSVSNRKNMIAKFIERLQSYVKKNSNKFIFPFVYTIDDFAILAVKKEYIENVYYDIKRGKKSYNLQIGMYFVKYESITSKVNKNIDICIAEALKVTGGKNNEEDEENDEDEDGV